MLGRWSDVGLCPQMTSLGAFSVPNQNEGASMEFKVRKYRIEYRSRRYPKWVTYEFFYADRLAELKLELSRLNKRDKKFEFRAVEV